MKTATLDQAGKILSIFNSTPSGQIQAMLGSGLLADLRDTNYHGKIDRDAIRQLLGLAPLELRITVNYNLSLAAMIAAGNYDWVNGNITAQRFPIVGEGIVEYETNLFHFNRIISSEKAVKAITSRDMGNSWRPGTIEHLLAFGAKYPDKQGKYPIVALGSPGGVGVRCVPCLDGGGSRRDLGLNCWIDGWLASYRFLAVRKVLVLDS